MAQSPTIFTVFSVYYKNGEYSVESRRGEEDLRAAAEELIEQFESPNEFFPPMEQVRALPFEELYSLMLEQGPKIIDAQEGYGWVAIIKDGVMMKGPVEKLS